MMLRFFQTTRIGMTTIMVVGLVVAQGAAAATVSELKTVYAQAVTTYQAAKTQLSSTKQTVLQGSSKTWTPDLISQTKTMVASGNEMLVAYLNWMEQKTNEMQGLPSGTQAEILTAVNVDRAWLSDHAAKLENASTKAEVVSAGRDLQRQWSASKNQFRKFHSQMTAANLLASNDRGDKAVQAFERIMASLKQNGMETAAVEVSINAAKEHFRQSKEGAEAANTKLSDITTFASAGSALSEANGLLKDSAEHIKLASQGLADTLSGLKALQTK